MRKHTLTTANIKFIKANRLTMTGSAMALKFGVGKGVVNRYMRKHKLQPPKSVLNKLRGKAIEKKFDPNSKENKYIKKHYLTIPLKRLSVMMGHTESFVYGRLKKLGLVVPPEIVEQRKKDSRIKKGNVPPNKGKKMSKALYKKCKATMFKKGARSVNTLFDGAITIRHDHKNRGGKPYKYIRLAPGKWYPLHQHNWEKKYGKQPKGWVVTFRNGDTMNCKVSNLKLITMTENMKRNSASANLTDGYVAFTICGRNGMHLYEEILADKKLIEVKRKQIILNRTINDREKHSAQAGKHEGKILRVRKEKTSGKKLPDKRRKKRVHHHHRSGQVLQKV